MGGVTLSGKQTGAAKKRMVRTMNVSSMVHPQEGESVCRNHRGEEKGLLRLSSRGDSHCP